MSSAPTLVWLRRDLRLADNPALTAALARRRPLVLLWLLDETSPGLRPLGGASRWWLHHSLAAFAADVARLGGRLILRRGPASVVVPGVAAECGADAVFWNGRHGTDEIAIDDDLTAHLHADGLAVESFRADLLHDPRELRTGTGGPYRVFTPFWRACLAHVAPAAPLPAPTALPTGPALPSEALDAFGLHPRAPDWSGGLAATWTPGEAGAAARLAIFLEKGIYSYSTERDRPDLDLTSHLSPHLRFGEISTAQVLAALDGRTPPPAAIDRDKFVAEIGWREFSHHLKFHFPDLASRNLQARFDAFPWVRDDALLVAWRRGRTGYPIVDAGMRQLWATGTMHNRVRMVAASFLVKHCRIDWREGEAWFWDTLVDACPAANPASWQWVAGSGADAAPFFRIFNPVTQGTKFDPDGDYVRRWVPELARLPAPAIHSPWTLPPARLAAAGVVLDRDYPKPVVDHAPARERALAAFAATAAEPPPERAPRRID